MVHKNRIVVALLLCSTIIASFGSSVASAADSSVSGITVTPGIVHTSVSKDAPDAQTVITIRNNYQTDVRVSAEMRGIDDASTKLLPTDSMPHDLDGVFNLSETLFTIPPLSDYKLTLQSRLIDQLTPGGHYASLLISQADDGAGNLSVRSAVSVTVFLTNKEGVKESLSLTKYNPPSSLFTLLGTVSYTLKNTGNVHTTPRGIVIVEGARGKILAQAVLNAGSNVVFPDKEFSSETKLVAVDKAWWPQKITTKLQFRSEGTTQVTEASSTRIYIPPRFVVLITVGIVGLLVLFRCVRWFRARTRKTAQKRLRAGKTKAKQDVLAVDLPDGVEEPDEGVKIHVRVKKSSKSKTPKKITITEK